MQAPISAVFSLFFLPISFFLSLRSFYSQFLTTLLPWVVTPLVFSFLGSLSLGNSLFLSASLRCFPSLRCFTRFHPWLALPLIANCFNEISPFYPHQLFWLVVSIPLVLPTNPLVAQPLLLSRIHLLHHYTFRDKILFCLFLLYTSTSRFKWIKIGLPHYLALWHASNGPNHLLLFLGKIPSQQGIFPKKVTTGNQMQTPLFPPPPNYTL